MAPELDEAGPADAARQRPVLQRYPDRHHRPHPGRRLQRPRRRPTVLEAHPGQVAGMILEPIMMNAGIITPDPGYLGAAEGPAARARRPPHLRRGEDRPHRRPLRRHRRDRRHPRHRLPGQGHRGGHRLGGGGRDRRGDGHVADGDYEMVGTFNGNPLAMAATRAMLTEVATPRGLRAPRPARRPDRSTGLERSSTRHGLQAHVVSVGAKGCVVFQRRAGPRLPGIRFGSTTATTMPTGWCSTTAGCSCLPGGRPSSG